MRSRTDNRAFTLIEVMLALTLGALVIGVSTTAAVQSVAIRRSVAADIDARWARVNLLDQFEQDVRSIVTWVPQAERNVWLPEDEAELLTMLALDDVIDHGTLMRRRFPARISYRIEQVANVPQSKQLVRRSERLVDGFNPGEEVVARRVAEVQIEAFDGRKWSSKRTEEQSTPLPLALRLKCVWVNDATAPAVRTVIVQADHSIRIEGQRK